MNILEEFRSLSVPSQENIQTVLSRLINAFDKSPQKTSIDYEAKRELTGDKYFDELRYLEILQKWSILKIKPHTSKENLTNIYQISGFLEQLNDLNKLLYADFQKRYEESWSYADDNPQEELNNLIKNKEELEKEYQKKYLVNTLENDTTDEIKERPNNWELKDNGTKGQLIKDGQEIFTFPTNWSNKFKYFQHLWNHYGKSVSYKETFESNHSGEYPEEKGDISDTNSDVRNEISKLKKDSKFSILPISIKVNRGFTLTIIE